MSFESISVEDPVHFPGIHKSKIILPKSDKIYEFINFFAEKNTSKCSLGQIECIFGNLAEYSLLKVYFPGIHKSKIILSKSDKIYEFINFFEEKNTSKSSLGQVECIFGNLAEYSLLKVYFPGIHKSKIILSKSDKIYEFINFFEEKNTSKCSLGQVECIFGNLAENSLLKVKTFSLNVLKNIMKL